MAHAFGGGPTGGDFRGATLGSCLALVAGFPAPLCLACTAGLAPGAGFAFRTAMVGRATNVTLGPRPGARATQFMGWATAMRALEMPACLTTLGLLAAAI